MNTFVNPFGFNTTPWFNTIPGFTPGVNNLGWNTTGFNGFNGWNGLTNTIPFNGFGGNFPVLNGWNNGWNFGGFNGLQGLNGFSNTIPFGGFNTGWNTTGFNTNPMWNFGGFNGFAKNTVNPGFVGGPTPFNGWNNTIGAPGFTPGFTPGISGGYNPGVTPGFNYGFNTPWNFGGLPFNFNGFSNATPWGMTNLPFGFNTNLWNGSVPGFWQNTPYGVAPTGVVPNTTTGFGGGYPQNAPVNPTTGVNGAYPGGLNSNLCREAA